MLARRELRVRTFPDTATRLVTFPVKILAVVELRLNIFPVVMFEVDIVIPPGNEAFPFVPKFH
jgi:hypothetical protein